VRIARKPSVMKWADLERDAPRMAAIAETRLITPGVLLVVTIRGDGSPRLSPVEPFILDGDLWLSMMWQSRKALDLARDSRILLHSIVTRREGDEGEVKVRGIAVTVEEPPARKRYRDAVAVLGWQPEEPNFHLFRINISNVTYLRYEPSGDQYVALWPQRREFIRRSTSPTSVGEEEAVSQLFASEDR
jgi:hypothetical protein